MSTPDETTPIYPTPAFLAADRNFGWRTITLFLLTVAGVLGCLGLMRMLLFPLVGALGLAVALRAPSQWLRRRYSPALAAAMLLAAVCLGVLLPGGFLAKSLAGEARIALHLVKSGRAERRLHRLTDRQPKMGDLVQSATDAYTTGEARKRMAGEAAVWGARGIGGLVHGITAIVLMLFFLFFFLRDQDRALAAVAALLPLNQEESSRFLGQLGELIYTVFVGRLFMAAVQGALAGLAYLVLGVPETLLWAVVTAIGCLIPAFGSFLVWVPIALYLGLAGSWVKTLLLALWGCIVISNVDNVLYPIIVGGRTRLHTAVIFVSVFGGVAVFGMAGLVLGPMIVASTLLLLQVWKRRLAAAP